MACCKKTAVFPDVLEQLFLKHKEKIAEKVDTATFFLFKNFMHPPGVHAPLPLCSTSSDFVHRLQKLCSTTDFVSRAKNIKLFFAVLISDIFLQNNCDACTLVMAAFDHICAIPLTDPIISTLADCHSFFFSCPSFVNIINKKNNTLPLFPVVKELIETASFFFQSMCSFGSEFPDDSADIIASHLTVFIDCIRILYYVLANFHFQYLPYTPGDVFLAYDKSYPFFCLLDNIPGPICNIMLSCGILFCSRQTKIPQFHHVWCALAPKYIDIIGPTMLAQNILGTDPIQNLCVFSFLRENGLEMRSFVLGENDTIFPLNKNLLFLYIQKQDQE